MARTVLVDSGFLVALMRKRDSHKQWAVTRANEYPPPWVTCEAVLSEAYHLLGQFAAQPLGELLRRNALALAFDLAQHLQPVLDLIDKYTDVPMALADACLVRMTEILDDPIILTTDQDFRVYRRHSRLVIPSVLPQI